MQDGIIAARLPAGKRHRNGEVKLFFLDWKWGSFPGITDLRSSTHDTCAVDDYFMACVLPRTIYILEIQRFLCILILQAVKVEI